jgi:hypothetical protein
MRNKEKYEKHRNHKYKKQLLIVELRQALKEEAFSLPRAVTQ